jgi:hypothetical protein
LESSAHHKPVTLTFVDDRQAQRNFFHWATRPPWSEGAAIADWFGSGIGDPVGLH